MERCDGEHDGPPCNDPECWNDDLTEEDIAILRTMYSHAINQVSYIEAYKMKRVLGKILKEI